MGLGLLAMFKQVPLWLWVVMGAVFYNYWYENPKIAREAKQGYVLEVEKTAVEAELAFTKRQLTAADNAAKAWREQLERFQQETDAREKQVEYDIDQFKRRIAVDTERRCTLSDSDIEFLLK